MASAGPMPGSIEAPAKSKTPLYVGLAAALALIGGFFIFGGSDPGGLVISVSGPGGKAIKGVTVQVDGKDVCSDSACKVSDLEPGSYVVKATAKGYGEMAGKAYEVAAGEQKAINIELIPDGGGTGLKVTSKASGLTLTVDGKKIGSLPQELTELTAGDHKIAISGSPFIKDFEQTVTVKDGEILEFEPDLKLNKGQVSIQLDESSKDAKVALVVDGKRRSLASTIKKAQSDTVKIDLPIDGKKYQLTATRKGYVDFEEDLEFSIENPVQTINLTLEKEGAADAEPEDAPEPAPAPRTSGGSSPDPAPRPAAASGTGTLNINSIPVSNVLLDGRPVGSTPKIGLTVSAGPHTVVFIHPQHGRKVYPVTVTAGKVSTAAVRFQ